MNQRFVALIALYLTTTALSAQGSAPQQGTPPNAGTIRTMRAVRAPATLRIDGKLDEPAWSIAEASADFTQSYPNAGAAPTEKSDVRVLYDDDAL